MLKSKTTKPFELTIVRIHFKGVSRYLIELTRYLSLLYTLIIRISVIIMVINSTEILLCIQLKGENDIKWRH